MIILSVGQLVTSCGKIVKSEVLDLRNVKYIDNPYGEISKNSHSRS